MHGAGLAVVLIAFLHGCDESATPSRGSEAATTDARVAAERDIVWSASSRIRIVRKGRVIARVNLDRAVTDIEVDEEKGRAYVAASNGLYLFTGKTASGTRQLTDSPARLVHAAHGRVWVLEHTVTPGPDGTPVPSPYRLRTLDERTLETVRVVEIGDRVLAFAPPLPGGAALLLHESGALRSIDWPQTNGTPLPRPTGGRLRQFVALSADASHAYLALEGPEAAVIDFDLATMQSTRLPLGRPVAIRGLVATPDGTAVLVNALRHVARVPIGGGRVEWASLDAPHQGAALSPDGHRLWLARPVDGDGGSLQARDAISLVRLAKVPLRDISPFVVAVR